MRRRASAGRAGRDRRPLWTVVVLATGLLLTATIAVAARGVDDPEDTARDAATDFLDTYVAADGRVVRHDEGGDTVSEGQAYAMLLAVAIGDEDRFGLVWRWTEEHLQRDDRLLAWRWDDGRVVDDNPAADADLLVSGALAVAGRRFADGELLDDGAAISDAVLEHETMVTGDGPVLAAGSWAVADRVVNPSYMVVSTMSTLWSVGEQDWAPIARTSRALLDDMTSAYPHLPPDWATIGDGLGDWEAVASPGGQTARYAFDAARVLIQLAVDCDDAGQAIAARPWPFFSGESAGTINAAYRLGGEALEPYAHPVGLVAAASSAGAAGDPARADDLLDDAESLDDDHPSYYGSAWVALGRVWLETDLLGGCRPGAPTR